MKNRGAFFLALLVFLAPAISALGGKEAAEEKKSENAEWTLCITAFDSSAMSPSWQTAGDTVARSLAGTLRNLTHRARGAEETAYYMKYALARSRAGAADALVKKRNERDLLLFRGDPSWKYQKDLKAAETEIEKLEKELAEKYAVVPEVAERPAFKLDEKSKNGTFSAPPEPGKEDSFCVAQKADAFVTGNLSEYYGRIFLELKMYTRYSNSYTYEDSVLFSAEDFNRILVEVSTRLAEAVSGSPPASVLVHAEPPEAMVLIDGVYTAQGETGSVTRSAGTAQISVRADNYQPVSFPLELNEGELAELFINLTPLSRSAFGVETPDKPGSRIYSGSLFVGETPLALELPKSDFSYITVETAEGEIGSAVYRDNSIVRGSAQFVRDGASGGTADFLTSPPASPEEKPVENARHAFYKSYGALWFILPAALLAGGIARNYVSAYDYVSANNLHDAETRSRLSGNASIGSVIGTGTYAVIGGAVGYSIYQIIKYVRASERDAAPIAKVPPKTEIE